MVRPGARHADIAPPGTVLELWFDDFDVIPHAFETSAGFLSDDEQVAPGRTRCITAIERVYFNEGRPTQLARTA